MTKKGITAYRVAHIQGADIFDWYLENEIHNFGYALKSAFRKHNLYYDEEEAYDYALALEEAEGYNEYGIITLDYSKFNFPGF